MRHPLALWGPVTAYMAAIFVLSAQPPADTPLTHGLDKLVHGVLYAGLGGLVARALAGGRAAALTGGRALAAWLISAVYAVTDEYHQAFVPGRTPDPADWVADAIGALVAVGTAWAWGIIRRSRRGVTAAAP